MRTMNGVNVVRGTIERACRVVTYMNAEGRPMPTVS